MIKFIEDDPPDAGSRPAVADAPRDEPAAPAGSFVFLEDEAPTPGPRAWRSPRWHYRAVGIASLPWNLIGALDYTMSEARNPAYLAASAERLGVTVFDLVVYFGAIPLWVVAAWALGVWGGVAGSLLVLFRRRQAAIAFGVSLAGLAVMTLYRRLGDTPSWARETGAQDATVWIVAAMLLAYAVAAWRKGLLR